MIKISEVQRDLSAGLYAGRQDTGLSILNRLNADGAAFNRGLFHLAFPIVLQFLAFAAALASAPLMLGRLGGSAVTAAALASLVPMAQAVLLFAVNGAGAILGAQYCGRGDLRALRLLRDIMLRVSLAVSGVFFMVSLLFPAKLMGLLTGDAQLVALGAQYLRLFAASCLLIGAAQTYHTVMRVTGRAAAGAAIAAVALGVNVALNAILISGLGFIPAMGIDGAALAATLSRIVELALVLAIAGQIDARPGGVPEYRTRGRALTRDYVKTLLPLLGSALVWCVGFPLYAVILKRMDADVAAAGAVALMIRGALCWLCLGVGSAVCIMAGRELGAGSLRQRRAFGERLMKRAPGIGVLLGAATLLLIPVVPGWVDLTAQAKGHLTTMLAITAVDAIALAINAVTINGLFLAGGDTAFSMYSRGFCMWGIALPLSVFGAIVFHWPVWVVFSCTCLDEVARILCALVHSRKNSWAQNLTRQPRADGAVGTEAPGRAADGAATTA